jgi:hypothetical protein
MLTTMTLVAVVALAGVFVRMAAAAPLDDAQHIALMRIYDELGTYLNFFFELPKSLFFFFS